MAAPFGLFGRLLSRLSVGRKLMLIYLLDLTAVIFVSSILINEKYLAINFAGKELAGNAYIAAVRDGVLDVALDDAQRPPPNVDRALAAAEAAHGAGLQTAELNLALAGAHEALRAAPPAQRQAATVELIARARALMTRIGNQSNLILDPDLDSYYTMSLVLLRYPELLELVEGIEARLAQQAVGGRGAADARSRYLILEGQLEAVRQGIESDQAEAFAAGPPALRQQLEPVQARLALALRDYQHAARQWVDDGARLAALPAVRAARQALLAELRLAWASAGAALDGLLQARIAHQYQRMWLHLGTALALLFAILGIVYFVARQIAVPLRHLAEVTDHVRRTGDHARRAQWHSSDEIGRLVDGFNEMLEQLDRERELQKELAASARAAEAQRALVEATPIALIVTAIPGHEVLHANPPAADWLGAGRGDPWKRGLESGVRARFFQQLADRGAVDGFEVRWLGGAEPAWAMLSARQVRFQGRDAVLTAFAPINQLKQLERRLELWAKVFESSSEGILIVDGQRRIVTANQALSRHTGYDTADVIGESPAMLMALPALEGNPLDGWWANVAARGSWQGELQVRRRNGSEYPAWLMVNVVRHSGGDISHYIFTSIDVSDRKKSEQRIRFLADHDALTGLPNRALCTERLRLAVQQARRDQRKVGVLFIDLDAFKDINDSLGHHVGDGLLRSVAQRLTEAVREGDTVSRLGGDEFVVVLNGVDDPQEISRVVDERLIPRIRAPHRVDGSELHVSCSVGIALFPDDADDIDELMRSADTAMYQAKAQGKNAAAFFTAEMTQRAQARLQLAAQLRRALELQQFTLHWQPRVCARSGALLGVEGLLRWTLPERGMVSPAQFVPLAEEMGLIVPIGAWVIEEACRQARAWREQGLPPMIVSINLSARQLTDDMLPATVRESLERHGLPAGVLELELTESMVMEGAERNLRQMHALRALGVGLAIDDFGTGYSSLAYLKRFPIDKLKIDRSFVHDMLGDETDRAITLAIIRLGHTLGVKVVAEGVERPAEAELLCEAGCDELQGFLFARPMPAAGFVAWLAQRQAAETIELD